MYQSIIKDPGGGGLIRIVPDICGRNYSVVNGSVMLVPPGTTAFVAINGQLSRPYGPGRYEIFTGVDPFFVRLRNLMTHGNPGISVSVFYISTQINRFMQMGTGEIPFCERRFCLTMKAYAACNLVISIVNPLKILEKLVGLYNSDFSDDDLEPCVQQVILGPIREAVSLSLQKYDVVRFNNHLLEMSKEVSKKIKDMLLTYGIGVHQFSITAINIPEIEMKRLNKLEQDFAEGKNKTDLELDQLQRIWGGNLNKRTFAEIMTGIPARGRDGQGNGQGSGRGSAGMESVMAQMMIMTQMLPHLRQPIEEMVNQTDLFQNEQREARAETSSANSPPPMPRRMKRCPACNGEISRSSMACPICGFKF